MNIKEIFEEYLILYPIEKKIQNPIIDFLKIENNNLFDINNSKGHITASGVVYCVHTDSLLLLEYKDLNKWYSPGGHRDLIDNSMLETAIRELEEETGLTGLKCKSPSGNIEIPFDIDSHIIPENIKWNMPKHYHHDFRYMFIINHEQEIKIDCNESNNYKWVNISALKNNYDFIRIISKVKKMLSK